MSEEKATVLAVLRIVGGPAAGHKFPLTGEEATLGRSKKVEVTLPDKLLSREHAKVLRDGAAWYVEDLNSTNGTWIHGQRVTSPVELAPNTAVRIGKTLFELHIPGDDDLDMTIEAPRISYRMEALSVAEMTIASGLSLRQIERERDKLSTIYHVQSLLTEQIDEVEMAHAILEAIANAIPADGACLFACEESDGELTAISQRDGAGRVETIAAELFSQSILQHVREKKEAISSVDVPHDDRFEGVSITETEVRSVICSPMMGQRGLCGVIYLFSMQASRPYQEEDLKLLTAIAHSAGMAIENKRLMDRNLRQERMAAMGMAAASLSHYVKNIITGLDGSISLMRIGIDTDDLSVINSSWEILSKNQKRLSSLVLDLLNLAKEDSLELALYNLSELVMETVEMLAAQAAAEQISINFEGPAMEEPIYAEIDSRGMHRVILNLLHNALDAVGERHAGTPEGRIDVVLRLENHLQTVVMEVRDNGIGVPAEETEKIFETFHSTKGGRGSGMGLAVTKRIVEGHGGWIEVESEVGAGACFTVRIPIRRGSRNTEYVKTDA